jgi:small subunit ribosomal protein S20
MTYLTYINVPACARVTLCDIITQFLGEEVNVVPNKKSAAKRVLIAEKNKLYNRYWKTRCKTTAKNLLAAVAGNDKELISTCLSQANSALDKAVTKGVVHRNTAARRKSRMSTLANPLLRTE